MLTHEQIVEAVRKAAPEYRISNAYYFGSYAKGTQNAESDLDLLVTFAAPTISLFTIAGLAADLEKSLKTKVDVIVWPLPKDTHLQINKVVKCYGG